MNRYSTDDSFFGNLRNGFMALPTAIRTIIGLCVGLYLVQVIGSLIPVGGGKDLNDWLILALAFDPQLPKAVIQIWRPFTYMFLHGAPFHLLFNMLWLWWMGRPVESSLGPRTFAVIFLGSGVAGALFDVALSLLLGPGIVIGASGAVYGVMVAFAMLYPRVPVMLFLLPPIEARYVVAGIILLDVLFLGTSDGVARIVHLGGAGAGYLLMKAHLQGVDLSAPARAVERLWTTSPASRRRSGAGSAKRTRSTGDGSPLRGVWRRGANKIISDAQIVEERESGELDRILEKIAQSGYDGLTKEEKKRLFELSKRS